MEKIGTNKIKKIRNNIQKKVPRINKKMWQGWEFPATSKTGTSLYFHYMLSKPISIQC